MSAKDRSYSQNKPEYFSDDKLYRRIIGYYLECESVKETAEQVGVSVVKVRRVLITEGLWTSRAAVMVERLLNEGKNIDQIAEELCISREAVRQYLPYSRGLYMGENRSVSAHNSEEYRTRIEQIRSRILQRKESLSDDYGLDETEGIPKERCNKYGSDKVNNPKQRQNFNDKEKKDMEQKRDNDLFDQYPGIVTLRELPEDKESQMPQKIRMYGEDIYRLHLELIPDIPSQEVLGRYEGSSEEYVDILRKYGDLKYGRTISRDILVPGGLQLYSLHYVIQRLFGWQNSHLHRFILSEDRMKALCDDNLMKFSDLIGVIFRSPWMDEDEKFWADDYTGGSFRTWLRRKYTDAPVSLCHGESYFKCREDVRKYLEQSVKHGVEQCVADTGSDSSNEEGRRRFIREELYEQEERVAEAAKKYGEKAAVRLMNLDQKHYLGIEAGDILERLPIEEVLCFGERKPIGYNGYDVFAEGDRLPMSYDDFMDEDMQDEIETVKEGADEPMNQPFINCVTDELVYDYDFGDGWRVSIKGSCGCEDLIEENRITQEKIDDALLRVYAAYRPVVIARDGNSVFDDVGGPEGYVQFLRGINGLGTDMFDYDDSEETLEWAKSLGWSKRRSSNKNFL